MATFLVKLLYTQCFDQFKVFFAFVHKIVLSNFPSCCIFLIKFLAQSKQNLRLSPQRNNWKFLFNFFPSFIFVVLVLVNIQFWVIVNRPHPIISWRTLILVYWISKEVENIVLISWMDKDFFGCVGWLIWGKELSSLRAWEIIFIINFLLILLLWNIY